MSSYAISDLHGFPVSGLLKLLDSAGFTDEDTLFIIGDVIDRNCDGGVEMLRHVMAQPNYEFILGNHEDMLLDCDFLFKDITEETTANLRPYDLTALQRYLRNGGGVTLENLYALRKESPEALNDILQFLRDAPHCGAVTAGGRDFLLVHGGLGGFSPDKKLDDYSTHDILWERPTLETRYFDDIITVFGHTPTLYYGNQYLGKVIFTPTWINIDTGAADRLPPALLRLDDLAVFYGEW